MAVFAVLASGDPANLNSAVESKILPQDRYQVDDRTWFISAPQSVVTPKEMSDFLDVSMGSAGRILVLYVTSYYGYHAKEAWDWLSAKGA
jgi:hypothetical protein